MKRLTCMLMVLLMAGTAVASGIEAMNGHRAELFFSPDGTSDPLVSFDWGSDGRLYYSTAATNWNPGMKVWAYDESTSAEVFSDAGVYAGSWVTASGDYIYFNEDSNYRVYRLDLTGGGGLAVAIEQNNLWGMFPHDGDMLISGADAAWNAAVYSCQLDSAGLSTGPSDMLGYVGSNSGPIAFDIAGNMYVAEGYNPSIDPVIYRFSAAELAAAIADPAGSSLAGTGHEWAQMQSYQYGGATALAFHADGNLLVTHTMFASPSTLAKYVMDDEGGLLEVVKIAVSDERMTTLRVVGESVYVAQPSGIYKISVPEPGAAALIIAGLIGLMRRPRRRLRR